MTKAARSPKERFDQRIGLSDIRERWGALDEIELAAIKSRADLVMQIQARYGLNKRQAETNFDIWAKGREL